MHSFEQLFAAIKKLCGEQGKFAQSDCFEMVAKTAGMPAEGLELYLDLLADAGLIRYSMAEKYIYITQQGANTNLRIKE